MTTTASASSNHSKHVSTSDQLREKAADLRDDVAALGRVAKDSAQEQWKTLRKSTKEQAGNLLEVVKEKPLASIGVACLTGVVIGVMLRR
jgi:ElaB/YqjD/DUF883 family membrane-anchored ribosome-binding protein